MGTYRLTNAALEGNDSRIRAIKQHGRGYRNLNNLVVVLYYVSWK